MQRGPEEAPLVRLEEVGLARSARPVFDGLSCAFPAGGVTVVLGGSGSGKSTLLRLIGGLVRPDRGRVLVLGRDVARLSERELFGVRDRIGMLFQSGALLDSMTVFDNVALPLRERGGLAPPEIRSRVEGRLAAVGLEGVGSLLPGELSGGMRRRAALARALVGEPDLVLCDEPFSGLDPVNVRRIEALLAKLDSELPITLILTSHHLASSLRLAAHLVFLAGGRALSGTPEEMLASRDPVWVEFLDAETRDAGGGAGASRGVSR